MEKEKKYIPSFRAVMTDMKKLLCPLTWMAER
jgi:hypothetical protein